jgi:hypothetical protein
LVCAGTINANFNPPETAHIKAVVFRSENVSAELKAELRQIRDDADYIGAEVDPERIRMLCNDYYAKMKQSAESELVANQSKTAGLAVYKTVQEFIPPETCYKRWGLEEHEETEEDRERERIRVEMIEMKLRRKPSSRSSSRHVATKKHFPTPPQSPSQQTPSKEKLRSVAHKRGDSNESHDRSSHPRSVDPHQNSRDTCSVSQRSNSDSDTDLEGHASRSPARQGPVGAFIENSVDLISVVKSGGHNMQTTIKEEGDYDNNFDQHSASSVTDDHTYTGQGPVESLSAVLLNSSVGGGSTDHPHVNFENGITVDHQPNYQKEADPPESYTQSSAVPNDTELGDTHLRGKSPPPRGTSFKRAPKYLSSKSAAREARTAQTYVGSKREEIDLKRKTCTYPFNFGCTVRQDGRDRDGIESSYRLFFYCLANDTCRQKGTYFELDKGNWAGTEEQVSHHLRLEHWHQLLQTGHV